MVRVGGGPASGWQGPARTAQGGRGQATLKGTTIGTSGPGTRSRSSSDTRARWISGDALYSAGTSGRVHPPFFELTFVHHSGSRRSVRPGQQGEANPVEGDLGGPVLDDVAGLF